jgi:hypothetical protein
MPSQVEKSGGPALAGTDVVVRMSSTGGVLLPPKARSLGEVTRPDKANKPFVALKSSIAEEFRDNDISELSFVTVALPYTVPVPKAANLA